MKAEALQRRIQDLEAAVSNADSRALAVQESLGGLSDREKMRRDRDIHRLRLGAVARLPKSSAVALLQDTCIAAELSDAEQLPSAVAKLTRVVAAVPKMEAFISRCCEAVFRRGCAFLPKGGEEGMDYDYSPHRVPEVLDHWLKQLGRLAELEEMRSAVAGHLAMRVVSGGGTPNLHPFTR